MEFETGGYRWWDAEMGGMVAHTQKWGDLLSAEGRAILHPPLSVFLAPSLNACTQFYKTNKKMNKNLLHFIWQK